VALRRKGRSAQSALPDGDTTSSELATLFDPPEPARRILAAVAEERRSWRGELALVLESGGSLPVAVRAEVVTARDGSVLGCFVIFVDLTDSRRVAEARRHLEQSLSQAVDPASGNDGVLAGAPGRGDLMGAILANASVVAMDLADGGSATSVAPLLEELEASTRRATMLYARIRRFETE